MSSTKSLLVVAFLCLTSVAPAWAERIFLPVGSLFTPLLADPKQPRISAALLYTHYPPSNARGLSVAAGGEIGLVREQVKGNGTSWQIGISGGGFTEFDIDRPSSDLVNLDYSFGVPITFRSGKTSIRFRPYHQSSHIGDEFLLRASIERVDFNYDSIESLFSIEEDSIRLYFGGEYLIQRNPGNIDRRIIHGGIEAGPPVRSTNRFAGEKTRLIVALDIKSWEEVKWSPAYSLKGGFEVTPNRTTQGVKRAFNILMVYYDGFTPYGQFYPTRLDYWGFEMGFTF